MELDDPVEPVLLVGVDVYALYALTDAAFVGLTALSFVALWGVAAFLGRV